MSQRLACASSFIESHFKIAHTTNAVKREDIAYTSASTAENQKLSENAYDNEPTTPAQNINHFLSSTEPFAININFCAKRTIDQYKNRIVNALASALIMLTA